MLTRIWVRNLACFGDADYQLQLAPETILVGPNNVGKSTMIGAYNFVRNFVINGRWEFDTASYRWGSHANIAHQRDPKRIIRMGIRYEGQLTGDFSIDLNPSNYTWGGMRDSTVQEELKRGWYFAPSRNEVQPNMEVGYRPRQTTWEQPLEPSGSNVITFLLERYTSRDPKWNVAEEWLKRIDPTLSILKSPLRSNQGSIETEQASGVDINISYQGTGIQKALTVIAGIVFSPEGSTIVVEEPEIHLHPRSQEVLADLFNLAVTKWGKQIIFTTHSWDMLLPFISDIGDGSERGKTHVKADPKQFRLVTFARDGDQVKIEDYNLKNKDFMKVRAYFKQLWG